MVLCLSFSTSQKFKQKVSAACSTVQLHLIVSNRWHSSLLSSEKHVSSFIIQCNWTRVRVYRYLVQQQTLHTEKKTVNTFKAATNSGCFLTEEYADFTEIKENMQHDKRGIRVCTQKWGEIKGRVSYLWSCIVGVSKLRERHSCFFCYHQQYSSPLIDCNQFYFKSTVFHTFPRTAFRSIIDDFTHRRETLDWHQLQIVLYEWIIPPEDPIRNEIKSH